MISKVLKHSYTDSHGTHHPDQYGLLDIPTIVTTLDDLFIHEIKRTGRQPGEYAIKENVRLEYRSWPNTVFFNSCTPQQLRKFADSLNE